MNWSKILTVITGLSAVITVLSGLAFEIEKVPFPPEWKGWIATIFVGVGSVSYVLKAFIPFVERMAALFQKTPVAPAPPAPPPVLFP